MFDVGTRSETIRERFRRKLAERPGRPVDAARLFRSLGKRKVWIVGAVFVGILLGLAIPYWMISHEWTSQAVVQWEAEEASGGAAGAVRDLRTLVDSVKLPTHLDQVREELGLEMTRDEIGSRLEVTFDRDSNVVSVAATADESEQSARIANAIVDVFLAHQADLARTRSEENVDRLREEIAAAQASVNEAQAEYDAFRRRYGISDLSLERQHAIELAAQLQSEAELARVTAAGADARAQALASGTFTSTRRVSSPALDRARTELEEARVTLSDAHPRVRALEARIQQLEAEAQASAPLVANVRVRAAERRAARAENRNDTYERVVAQARERLSQLSEVEGEASRLLSGVQVKEAALAELEGVFARAHAEMTTTNSGFRLLAPALPPEEPSSSNRRAMAVFILLGIVAFTIVVLLLYELRGLRAHTANEIAFWGRGPVLGATPWPNTDYSLAPLIEELGDYALECGGTTLVLGASRKEATLASEVAERLHLDTDVLEDEDDVYVDPEHDVTVTMDEVRDSAAGRSATVTPPPRRDPRKETLAYGSRAAAHAMDPSGGAPRSDVIDVGVDEDAEPLPLERPSGRAVGTAIVPARKANGNGHAGRAAFALARRPDDWCPPKIAAWRGADAGPPMRRAARVADRVIIVIPAGGMSFSQLERLRQTIGREDDDGVGYLVVGVRPELATLPDRAGPVESFWRARRAHA